MLVAQFSNSSRWVLFYFIHVNNLLILLILVKSGSFVHDISLSHPNWQPTEEDFRTIGAELIKLAAQDLKIERLEVSHDVALEIFKNNPFKREQLPNISNQHNGIVTLYRVGDHIDISRGPMIASTRFVSKVNIASVHKVSAAKDSSSLYRVQGIALPIGFSMSHFGFNILKERAKKLVSYIFVMFNSY